MQYNNRQARRSGDLAAFVATPSRPVLIDLGEPRDHTCVGLRLDPLGYDVGVEQEAHNSVFRNPPFGRGPVRGD